MDVSDIRQKAVKVLKDLDYVRNIPEDRQPEKDALWAEIVREMKAFPKARPGLRHVYSSSLKRASATAELAAMTANNLPPINLSVAIQEIQLGQVSDDQLTQKSEDVLMRAHTKEEALEQLQALYASRGLADPMADTPENRQYLSDPEASFEGGDSTQDYAARVIKGYTAILTHALEEGARPIDAILATLPAPEPAFIHHVFAVQQALKSGHAVQQQSAVPETGYAPFAAVCRQLAGHRVVLARHGETAFSKQKILTGGHIDAGLIHEGVEAAIETGILLKLYNKTHPNDVKIIQIFGHSAASSIIEAAICACCQRVEGKADGQFKVAEPHIYNFAEGGTVTVTPVSRASLLQELIQA